jgi:hypothetical protein
MSHFGSSSGEETELVDHRHRGGPKRANPVFRAAPLRTARRAERSKAGRTRFRLSQPHVACKIKATEPIDILVQRFTIELPPIKSALAHLWRQRGHHPSTAAPVLRATESIKSASPLVPTNYVHPRTAMDNASCRGPRNPDRGKQSNAG